MVVVSPRRCAPLPYSAGNTSPRAQPLISVSPRIPAEPRYKKSHLEDDMLRLLTLPLTTTIITHSKYNLTMAVENFDVEAVLQSLALVSWQWAPKEFGSQLVPYSYMSTQSTNVVREDPSFGRKGEHLCKQPQPLYTSADRNDPRSLVTGLLAHRRYPCQRRSISAHE